MRASFRGWMLVLAVLLAPACARAPLPPLSLDAGLDLSEPERGVIRAARQAVVSIFYEYGDGPGGGRRSGSGFLVGPRLVVTDYHVVWGRPRFLTILGPDGRLGPRGRLDTVSPSYDLALIVLEGEWGPAPPLPLATQVVPGSRAVVLAGRWVPTECSRHTTLINVRTVTIARPSGAPSPDAPGGEPGGSTAGEQTEERRRPSELLIFPPDQVCRGFSGGPVLNMRGEVIGVVRGAVRGSLPGGGPRNELNAQWAVATSVRHVREALVAFHLQPR